MTQGMYDHKQPVMSFESNWLYSMYLSTVFSENTLQRIVSAESAAEIVAL